MKRITETDIRVLRSRAGRTPKPKTKVGIDGVPQLVGDSFKVTKESLDIISYAGQCKSAFEAFCRQADRSADYYKGNQYESGNCILVHSLFVFFAEANIEYVRAHA